MHMDKNNNKSKRDFIPQYIGNTIKKISRNFTSKFGRIEFIIHSNWPKIAGSYFSEYSEPKSVSNVYDSENELGETVYKSYLNVSVAPAAALEFQHFKDTIIDKINSYFGYRAIMDLRIQQNYLPKVDAFNKKFSNRNSLTLKEEKLIKNNVEDMKNNDLKDSLISLGVNITKDNK